MVILHIVDSSKLGYRMDFVEDIKSLNRQYSKRLLTVIDACQSRADISRIRQYLKYGCMVIITGSKFEEGPPFSGATIIPEMITDSLTKEDFVFFPDGLKNFITEYDVSGSIKDMLSEHLPSWMNCGLMMRWTCALINWQNYRSIEQEYRNRMVREWIANFLNLAKQYPDLEIFSGGEAQQGAVGDLNSIISLKIIYHDKPIQIDDARTIYHLLFKDITLHLPEVQGNEKCSVLKQRFLIGQPVNLGHFAVLRVALGAKLVCRIEKYGMENILKDDKALLLKLSLILKHYDKIRKNYKRK